MLQTNSGEATNSYRRFFKRFAVVLQEASDGDASRNSDATGGAPVGE
jgi:hypothetical protein